MGFRLRDLGNFGQEFEGRPPTRCSLRIELCRDRSEPRVEQCRTSVLVHGDVACFALSPKEIWEPLPQLLAVDHGQEHGECKRRPNIRPLNRTPCLAVAEQYQASAVL